MKDLIEIDGSFGEGGGAILRTALGLSAITQKPIKIFNIRKGRKEPGLRTQHLESIKAVADLCNARLTGANLGSTEIEFYPGKIESKNLDIKIGTAGSIGLVFQSLKLIALKLETPIQITITGGATFGKFAPPTLYTKHTLLPILSRVGYNADIDIIKNGFFPVGGAKAIIKMNPCKELKPLILDKPGEIEKIHGLSIASRHLEKANVAYRQAKKAEDILDQFDVDIKIEYVDADCPGSGIVLWAKDKNGNLIGSDGLGERGKPAEAIGEEAAKSLLKAIHSTVDSHTSDQLLTFMALAKGNSRIIAPKLTDHAKTNIWVIKKFLKTEFKSTEKENVSIECRGQNI